MIIVTLIRATANGKFEAYRWIPQSQSAADLQLIVATSLQLLAEFSQPPSLEYASFFSQRSLRTVVYSQRHSRISTSLQTTYILQ